VDSDIVLERLDAPTAAPAWPHALGVPPAADELPSGVQLAQVPEAEVLCATDEAGAVPSTQLGRALLTAIPAAARALLALEQQLDAWDAAAGDGDCGSTLARGARAVLEDCPRYRADNLADTLAGLAGSVRRAVGGTSGALLDVLFTAAEAEARAGVGAQTSLHAGIAAVARVGGAQPGMRTMLDALVPAVTIAQGAATPADALSRAAAAAEAGAEATKTMPARAGRASYVSSAALKAGDIPDPGAFAVAAALLAAADALSEQH
jgi:dihydroxyacetone kinase